MAFIFFTSPTSGTASMQRIISAVASGCKIRRVSAMASDIPKDDCFYLDPTPPDVIYWFQGPRHWNSTIDLNKYKVIAHFRDPRDLACNQYWWALQHPNTRDAAEIAEQKRRTVEARGINHYVVNKNLSGLFNIYLDMASRPDGQHIVYTSYAQLCCAFDFMTDNLCSAFDRSPRDVIDALRIERPENLSGNVDWVKVGGTWQGSDISPGRFRSELSDEAVEAVTVKYQTELANFRSKDAPFLRVHYF